MNIELGGAGFVPLHSIPFTPKKLNYGALMAQRYDIPEGQEIRNMHVGTEKRPDRDGMHNGTLARWSARMRSLEYHNALRGSDGQIIGHVNINEDIIQRIALQHILTHLAKTNQIRVITPFVNEQTAELAASYNAFLVGETNVVPVEAGLIDPNRQASRKDAIISIENAGMEVVSQPQSLAVLNWRSIREQFNIFPTQGDHETDTEFNARWDYEMDQAPQGSKGETMFAGILKLFAQDKVARQQRALGLEHDEHAILEDATWIVFHDTDIKNVEEYASTEYLAFAMLYSQNPNLRTIQIARHGIGRNNHPMMHTASMLTNPQIMPNEKVQRMGRTLESLSWPLTGERAIRWGELKHMPWTNGMGIETWINLWMASRDVLDNTRGVAQVANPNPKIEDGVSDPRREHAMIYGLAEWMYMVSNYSAQIDKLPGEWTTTDVGEYNRVVGGTTFSVVTPDEWSESDIHAQMKDSERKADYLFPSLEDMYTMNLIDIKAAAIARINQTQNSIAI